MGAAPGAAGADRARLVPVCRRVRTPVGIGAVLGALTGLAMLWHWPGPPTAPKVNSVLIIGWVR
jgi:hypothetical protein